MHATAPASQKAQWRPLSRARGLQSQPCLLHSMTRGWLGLRLEQLRCGSSSKYISLCEACLAHLHIPLSGNAHSMDAPHVLSRSLGHLLAS